MSALQLWLRDARGIMLLSFIFATCLAIGHHFFYQSLDGQPVNLQRLTQNQNIYVDTALTFLVKTFLSAVVAAAYTQLLWRRLLGQESRIAHVDSLSALASSPTALDDWRLVRYYPLLVVIGAVAWCVSLVTVVPPGTLAVAAEIQNTSSASVVPMLDFSLPLVTPVDGRGTGRNGVNLTLNGLDGFSFSAPPKGVASALTTVTALTGELPRLPSARLNSSYSVSFFGPALQCSTAEIRTNGVYCYSDSSAIPANELKYLSFMTYPLDTGADFGRFFDLNASVPLGSDGNISCSSITTYRTSTFGAQPPQLFVVEQTSYSQVDPDTQIPIRGWNATTCTLGNATYIVDVEVSVQRGQSVQATVSDFTPLDSVPSYIPGFNTSSQNTSAPSANKIYNYLAMMSLMAQITVGTVDSTSSGSTLLATNGGLQDITPVPLPNIFTTRLATSPEMWDFAHKSADSSFLTSSPFVDDTSPFAIYVPAPPLGQQLEDLFINMTLALLSSSLTSSNASIQVSHWEPRNIYAYSARHLWMAYGVGLLVAGLVGMLGFVTVVSSGASYSTKFSTFLRTVPWSRGEDGLGDIGMGGTGADPTPRKIAASKIVLGGARRDDGVELLEDSRMLKGSSDVGALGTH